MGTPVEAIADRTQQLQKPVLVGLIPIDGLAGIAAGGEVVEGAGEFQAQGAGHVGALLLSGREERYQGRCFIARPDPFLSSCFFLLSFFLSFFPFFLFFLFLSTYAIAQRGKLFSQRLPSWRNLTILPVWLSTS